MKTFIFRSTLLFLFLLVLPEVSATSASILINKSPPTLFVQEKKGTRFLTKLIQKKKKMPVLFIALTILGTAIVWLLTLIAVIHIMAYFDNLDWGLILSYILAAIGWIGSTVAAIFLIINIFKNK